MIRRPPTMTAAEYAGEVMESARREWGWLVACQMLLDAIPTDLLREVIYEREREQRERRIRG